MAQPHSGSDVSVGTNVIMSTDPLSIIAGTADAAFGTDETSRIVIWNRPAEELLGYSASRVLGRNCCEVLCGLDPYGNSFCRESCTLQMMARRKEAIHHFEMDVKKESGKRIRVGVSVVVVPGPKSSQHTLIHLLQLLGSEPQPSVEENHASIPGDRTPESTDDPLPLTGREIEILQMLADGQTAREIADSLFISVATVRNHTQNILRKLDVHSKTEAVSLALRHRLI